MTKFVFFDLGNVLLDFDHQRGIDRIVHATDANASDVQQAIFDSGLQERFETGLVSSDDFHAQVCESLDLSIDKNQLLHFVSDIFTIHHPVLPLVAQMAATQFPRAILSNTCSAHWEFVIDRFSFVPTFLPDRILSFEQKSMKPDNTIYHDAIEFAGVDPSEIFFTDDRTENVEGAISAGIDAVQYTSAKNLALDFRKRGINLNY